MRKNESVKKVIAVLLVVAMFLTLAPVSLGGNYGEALPVAEATPADMMTAVAEAEAANQALRIWNDHIPLINPPGNVGANGVNALTGAVNPNTGQVGHARVSYPSTGTGLQDTWWHEQILALGNGRLAGMVFGAPGLDRLAFHCKTHWAGGPHPNDPAQTIANNPYGIRATPVTAAEKDLIRQELDNKTYGVWGSNIVGGVPVSELLQNTAGQRNDLNARIAGPIGSNFGANGVVGNGDIIFDFAARAGMSTADFNNATTNYMRDLNLNTAISTVNYTFGGVDFTREIFVNHPDDVMVVRFTASQPNALNFDIEISTYSMLDSGSPPAVGAVQRKNAVINRDITTFTHASGYHGLQFTSEIENNGLLFNSRLVAINDGGTVTPTTRYRQQVLGAGRLSQQTDGMLEVTGATEVVLIFAGGTDYLNIHPHFRTGETPAQLDARILATLTDAVTLGYDELRARHIADHWEFFGRVDMDLSGVGYVPSVPTDELLLRYQRSLIPARPFVDVARVDNADGPGIASVTTSGQWNANHGDIRLNDGNVNTVWFSTNIGDPWVIYDFGEARRVDRIQLVAVTPYAIVEVSPDPIGDNWINVSDTAAIEVFGIDMTYEIHYHEFTNIELVLANFVNA
ncbi:MAG: glycoside hydrolase N-terminal domain-containing protein, partial [Oscillospiraceae bacterium]|nr:glycoside hydrolase N-terminal domain-containing protein [Oscillospiraceae bacterium]